MQALDRIGYWKDFWADLFDLMRKTERFPSCTLILVALWAVQDVNNLIAKAAQEALLVHLVHNTSGRH